MPIFTSSRARIARTARVRARPLAVLALAGMLLSPLRTLGAHAQDDLDRFEREELRDLLWAELDDLLQTERDYDRSDDAVLLQAVMYALGDGGDEGDEDVIDLEDLEAEMREAHTDLETVVAQALGIGGLGGHAQSARGLVRRVSLERPDQQQRNGKTRPRLVRTANQVAAAIGGRP